MSRRPTLHSQIIDDIAARFGLWRRGFFDSMRKAAPEIADELRHSDNRKTPDAHAVDPIHRTIHAFEVEISHPLREDDINAYSNIFWLLDGCGWFLHVYQVDRRGVITALPYGWFAGYSVEPGDWEVLADYQVAGRLLGDCWKCGGPGSGPLGLLVAEFLAEE